MRSKGVLGEHSPLRTCSGKKTVRNGKVKENCGNVVFIDLESENGPVNGTDSLQQKFRGSSAKLSCQGIINVDDDEENDVDPEIAVEDGGDFDSDATSSKSPCSAFNHGKNFIHLDFDECEVVQEKSSAFEFSKHKQPYFAKSPGRNRYGLDFEFDDGSSDSDCSDCELIEDSRGKFREQWEKAFQKRKHVLNRRSGLEDQASASGSNSESRTSVEEENRREQHPEAPTCSTSSSADYGKENLSDFVATENSNEKVEQETFSSENHMSAKEKESSHQHIKTRFVDIEQNFREGLRFCDSQSIFNNFNYRKTSFQDEETSLHKNMYSGEKCGNRDEVVSREKDDEFSEAPFTFNIFSSNDEHPSSIVKEKLNYGQPFVSNSRMSDEEQVDNIARPDDKAGGICEEFSFCRTSSEGESEVSSEKACNEEKVRQASSCYSTCNETRSTEEEPCMVEEARESCDVRDSLHAQDGHVTSVERGIISEREKLKETDEYKLAIEAEWASRQRELQIQSEEAQRLRKKKRAETLRLENMQRRQKQRLEEVRETQKKDEENLNLKEQLRVEIRKELDILEMKCINMPSLLRGLGIQVGNDVLPISPEVHAAYKRAVLKFHPDRASRNDIREQVEAEEKFKLISRMKDKFLSTSCF
ncbi:hypothetical protein FNV43_RR26353 [Rhamnella rubrinervis]|uniref:J domain-containing protein n=1 Tax=Rhamnella rubrinervis TaxID=2594499 RepID=A0A8K0GJJ6_9ROSA|nr:hypothetical protein FNV43_RR26353 [Rhamnella rubrinervis]